jgi:hypothetical protein
MFWKESGYPYPISGWRQKEGLSAPVSSFLLRSTGHAGSTHPNHKIWRSSPAYSNRRGSLTGLCRASGEDALHHPRAACHLLMTDGAPEPEAWLRSLSSRRLLILWKLLGELELQLRSLLPKENYSLQCDSLSLEQIYLGSNIYFSKWNAVT